MKMQAFLRKNHAKEFSPTSFILGNFFQSTSLLNTGGFIYLFIFYYYFKIRIRNSRCFYTLYNPL